MLFLFESLSVTDWRNQINMALSGVAEKQKERTRAGVMQACREADDDMGIMRCHSLERVSPGFRSVLWGNGGLVEVMGAGAVSSASPEVGLRAEGPWLTGSLTWETPLNVSDQSTRQRWGGRTVLKGWWVINDSEGVASGLTVTDSWLALCNSWRMCVSWVFKEKWSSSWNEAFTNI